MENSLTTTRRAAHRRRMAARLRRVAVKFVLFVFLLGLSYIVLFPFLAKISASVMSHADLYDPTVSLVPRHLVLDNYKAVIANAQFSAAFANTVLFSVLVCICTVMSSLLIGYGLAHFRFVGNRLIFVLTLTTMLVPYITLSVPLYSTFRFFNPLGIVGLLLGNPLNLTDSVLPLVFLSITGLGFRGGIFIILMRQFFRGVPNELAEAAYVDGAGQYRTFFSIMLPMARSMIIVVIVLSFAWQWTDTYYSGILLSNTPTMPNLIQLLTNVPQESNQQYYYYVLANTGVIIMIVPLLLVYVLFQRKIIAGIERSGIVG